MRAAGLWVAALVGLVGCDPDSPPDTPLPDELVGTWTMSVLVVQAEGGCDGEAGNTGTATVTIAVTPLAEPDTYSIVIAGLNGSPANMVTGSTDPAEWPDFVVSGSYPEDGGITTGTHMLTVSSIDHITGTELWTWDGDVDCPNGVTTVDLTRE